MEGRTEGETSLEPCCQLLELDRGYTRNRLFGRRLGSPGSLPRSNTKRARKLKRAPHKGSSTQVRAVRIRFYNVIFLPSLADS